MLVVYPLDIRVCKRSENGSKRQRTKDPEHPFWPSIFHLNVQNN